MYLCMYTVGLDIIHLAGSEIRLCSLECSKSWIIIAAHHTMMVWTMSTHY
jgi:hypothetical protein